MISSIFRYIFLHIIPLRYYSKSPAAGMSSSLPIIISLTTIPNRINKIRPQLKSLLHQIQPASMIYLAIPKYSIREEKKYKIPDDLKSCSRITILNTEKDWGPATKIIPTFLKEVNNRNAIIIIVDDDNIYPKEFISTLVSTSEKYPDAALGLCGRNLTESLQWPWSNKSEKGHQVKGLTEVDVIMGCGGILVKPRFFNSNLYDYSQAPKEAFFVDDIWINGHLARNGIHRIIIPFKGSYVYWPALFTLFTLSLDKTENLRPDNNNTVIKHFRDYWRQ